jgi:hypothetical protein
VDERLEWFARYGVRECRLVHQDDRTIAVERFEGRRVSGRTTYREDEPIASAVLPDFRLSFEEIMEARA